MHKREYKTYSIIGSSPAIASQLVENKIKQIDESKNEMLWKVVPVGSDVNGTVVLIVVKFVFLEDEL